MRTCLLCVAFAICASAAAQDRVDILIADFEGETYAPWKAEGPAFGERPAKGTLPNQMPVSGFEGKQLVNSYAGGDDSTGKLTSPEFKIERKHINFLIGGGKWPGETCINLVIDGKTVRTATGPNDKPGGSEQLDWASWDVAEFAGKMAMLEIVDSRKGGWGHINVDHILQSDRASQMQTLRREFTADKRYLLLPVKNGAPKRRARLYDGQRLVREFEIELALNKADFETQLDLLGFRGKKLALEVDRLPSESKVLESLALDDIQPGMKNKEAARPRVHFTSQRGWLNDPNGLVYYDSEWHLFYQHNPYGWDWGNMHWGHAVSKDLILWQELGDALYPQRWDDFAFSGSAVVDKENTSGFKQGNEDTLVAAYTSTGRGECIVYSNDRGRTWKEYEGNPVVKHAGRDPKLLWHEPTKHWVMAVYDEWQNKQWIKFYHSADLKQWKFTSRIEGYFECPDLFELPVIGKEGEKLKPRWVLYAADGRYALGDFDGREFKPDGPKQTLWHGNFYAAQTFSDAPHNRRIQIGWARGVEFKGLPFNQQMTIPVELALRKTGDAVRMQATPVAEINQQVGLTRKLRPSEAFDLPGGASRLRMTFRPAAKTESIVCRLGGLEVAYAVAASELRCKDVKVSLPPNDAGVIDLDIILDTGSVEIFANSGAAAISTAHPFFQSQEVTAKCDVQGEEAKFYRLEISELVK